MGDTAPRAAKQPAPHHAKGIINVTGTITPAQNPENSHPHQIAPTCFFQKKDVTLN
jgi:hypothetical protein